MEETTVYDIMIAAFPEAALNIIVTQGEDAAEVERVLAFEPDMVETIDGLIQRYGGFETATLYGPQAYIEHIRDTMVNSFDTAEVSKIAVVAL